MGRAGALLVFDQELELKGAHLLPDRYFTGYSDLLIDEDSGQAFVVGVRNYSQGYVARFTLDLSLLE